MATDEHTEIAGDDAGHGDAAALVEPATDEPATDEPDVAGPSWWHRSHPVFTPLSGFFTGLVVVIVVPGLFGAVLRGLFDYDTAEHLFPFAAVVLGVPLVLIAVPRTRRFGLYMLVGMLITAVVVICVAALTLWILIANDG